MKPTGYDVVVEYARSILEGRKIACREKIQECERFFRDLENPAYEFDCKDPEFVIRFIETCVSHKEGESLKGEPLLGKPLLLEPWEKFIVYNLLGFRLKGTKERRFKEAFLFVARKNGKTPFSAALALALAFLERRSGSRIYIVGAALKQARQAFDHILFNLDQMGELRKFRVLDNNAEHSISRIKPIWDKTAGRITVAEIVSMCIGIMIAVVAKINFLAGVVEITQSVLQYVLYALTGVALGRGPSFVHDLWGRIRGNIEST